MEIYDLFKEVLGYTAIIVTVGLYMYGIPICKDIIRKGNANDVSPLPFLTACVSTSLWFCYGFLVKDTAIVLVNGVGGALQVGYVIIFCYFSINKKAALIRVAMMLSVLISIFAFLHLAYGSDVKAMEQALGIITCTATLIFFSSPLANIVIVVRSRSSKILPFNMVAASFTVSSLWFVYGVLIKDSFVQIPNFIGSCITGFQMMLFYIYPADNKLENL